MSSFEPQDLHVVNPSAYTIQGNGNIMNYIDYNVDGSLVGYSNGNGTVHVATSYDSTPRQTIEQEYSKSPVAGIKFHPAETNLILSTFRDGYIFLSNIDSGGQIAMTRHLGSNLLAVDVDTFGEIFAIACADGSIRIYDIQNLQRTKALVKMTGRTASTSQINIYSVLFHPEDSNVILAAGWNDKILFWDVRTGNSERSINGPHIRGLGLDIYDNTIVSVSSRDKKQVEYWDYRNAKKIRDVSIDSSNTNGPFMPALCKVSRNGQCLSLAGQNYVQIYDFESNLLIGQTAKSDQNITTLAISPYGTSFVYGTDIGSLTCYMIRLKPF